MCIYYLYIKTHKNTGLKYLGKTKQDPFKYSGSGVKWLLHLKQYGVDHHTEVIFETNNSELFNIVSRYYSNYYHIVNAMDDFGNKIWANQIPETGGGPGFTSEYLKMTHNRPETKEKIRKISTEIMNRPEQIEMRSGDKNVMRRPDLIERMKVIQKKSQNMPETKDKRKSTWEKSEIKNKVLGKNSKRYNHTQYVFKHTNGESITCTQRELIEKYNLMNGHVSNLIHGKRKTHKGWSLLSLIR
jgi:hypothetical protein